MNEWMLWRNRFSVFMGSVRCEKNAPSSDLGVRVHSPRTPRIQCCRAKGGQIPVQNKRFFLSEAFAHPSSTLNTGGAGGDDRRNTYWHTSVYFAPDGVGNMFSGVNLLFQFLFGKRMGGLSVYGTSHRQNSERGRTSRLSIQVNIYIYLFIVSYLFIYLFIYYVIII